MDTTNKYSFRTNSSNPPAVQPKGATNRMTAGFQNKMPNWEELHQKANLLNRTILNQKITDLRKDITDWKKNRKDSSSKPVPLADPTSQVQQCENDAKRYKKIAMVCLAVGIILLVAGIFAALAPIWLPAAVPFGVVLGITVGAGFSLSVACGLSMEFCLVSMLKREEKKEQVQVVKDPAFTQFVKDFIATSDENEEPFILREKDLSQAVELFKRYQLIAQEAMGKKND